MRPARTLTLLTCCLLMQACTQIGPGTIPRDRFDYNSAITDSWKQQTLLNVVKLRYADMPMFVEVASVVSGYQFESSVSVGGTASSDSVQGDFLNFGGTGKYTDRPTITYRPITGSQFNRSFMVPIPPQAVLFLLQTGWSPTVVFPLTVDSVNGLRAQVAAGIHQREGDSDFYRIVQLLAAIQRSGAVGMRIQKKGNSDATVLFFHRESVPDEVRANIEELYRLLDLDESAREFIVTYGTVPKNRAEIAVTTLSMLQILIKLATLVDVPPEDVASGSTVPSLVSEGVDEERRLIRIRQGPERPGSAFAAVRYRNRWFWIDDTDFASKRVFTFVMVLFSLTETGGNEGLPLVTIPAG